MIMLIQEIIIVLKHFFLKWIFANYFSLRAALIKISDDEYTISVKQNCFFGPFDAFIDSFWSD